MTSHLSERDLLGLLISSFEKGEWQTIPFKKKKPFHIRIFKRDGSYRTDVRVYIWNCTHGGGAARPSDEYRIQITGAIPKLYPDAETLLLGWHLGHEVFVGFDIQRHRDQSSSSPSIQVKESTLLSAHTRNFAAQDRGNGEIAIAFRPVFLGDYAVNASALHQEAGARRTPELVSLLNQIDTLTFERLSTVEKQSRRALVSTIRRKYREHDFRLRVLTAYRGSCAMCGTQLKLVEAAHIIPVAADEGTDETANGVALCSLHHSAFDRNLISFNERFQVEVNQNELERLRTENHIGGWPNFNRHLKTAILLPADRRDYPKPEYVKLGRALRNWSS